MLYTVCPLLEVPVVTGGEADIRLYLIGRSVLRMILEADYRVLVLGWLCQKGHIIFAHCRLVWNPVTGL